MKVSQELEHIIKTQGSKGSLYLKDFIAQFGDRSLAFIVAILTLPIALPFTPPGINSPFGVICIFLSIYIMLNVKEVKLPGFIENRTVPFKPEGWFFKAMTKLLQRIEMIIKPRLHAIVESRYSRPLLGFGMLCSSIVMLLPLPIVNSISSSIVLLIAIGMITKDGLIAGVFSIAGVLLLMVCLVLLSGSIFLASTWLSSLIGSMI